MKIRFIRTKKKKKDNTELLEDIRTPPYAIIHGKNVQGGQFLTQYTPWAITLKSLAYRDLMAAFRTSFRQKEEGVRDVADWISKHTLNVSRETGKVSRLNFLKYPWQLQIMNDPSRRVCVQKCTQVGISEICLRKGLWFVITNSGTTLMYTLPDESLANNFSDIRLETVVEKSPYLSQAVGDTDSYGRKRFGDSWVIVQSSYSKRGAQSTPVDFLIVDEEDFSMPGIRTSLNERLSSSPHNFTIDISIPLKRGAGINRLWSGSTRNRWMIVCKNCSKINVDLSKVTDLWEFQQTLQRENLYRQYLTLDHIMETNQGDWDYCCEKCGHVLDRTVGHWEFSLAEVDSKTHGGASEYWSGYKVSQLCAPYISAGDILAKKKDYEQGLFQGNEGESDFYSHVLGEPPQISSSDLRLPTQKEIEALFLRYYSPADDLTGRCSMGIDWGLNSAWGVISKPIEYDEGEIVRTILALILVEGKDVMLHAKNILHYIERYNVGTVFADFGYGAAQNKILADALEKDQLRFWQVVSSNPSYKQIAISPQKVYQTRFNAKEKQVHVMANTIMRRHVWGTIRRNYYMMRQPTRLYAFWREHHERLTLERLSIPGSDIEIVGFGKSGPDHLCRAACYDLLAYEFLRRIETHKVEDESKIEVTHRGKPRIVQEEKKRITVEVDRRVELW